MPETALERKVRSGPKPAETLDHFARACEVGMGAALNFPALVSGSDRGEITARDAVSMMVEGGLVLLLDGPEGRMGAMIFPPELGAGMIELLTFGVLSHHPITPRVPTTTDAAVIEPVVREVLNQMAARSEDRTEPMRFGALLSPQHFARVMPEGALDFWSAQVSLSAERTGRVWLLETRPVIEDALPDPEVEARWREEMTESVAGAAVRLDVVLGPLRLALADINAWDVGTVLPLSIEMLESAEVRVNGGEAMGGGHVGRFGGMRAVRLVSDKAATEELVADPLEALADPGLPALAETISPIENGEDDPIPPV
ncbi:FliM/FliN family flagellar motor switch protein [Donghicola sp. XS_ASV15]|uniref:FliM/FliN family flagellar motor switch protein n=1 Tax=Donghicola sp. XS_ASV15 TaxID=3241295 RepID=UPI003518F532